MNRRFALTTVVLGSAAVLLGTACGSSYAASGTPTGGAKAVSAVAKESVQVSAAAAGNWKACYKPKGYDHFFAYHSAKLVKGKVTVRVTPETCKVNTHNDEDVVYTPSGAARSLVVPSTASVKVLNLNVDTSPHKVAPRWLVSHKLTNADFYYRVNSKNQVTATEEIYHP